MLINLVMLMTFLSAHNLLSKDFIIGGWLPYWRCSQSINSAQSNIHMIDQVSLFSYDVDDKGNLIDTLKPNAKEWSAFFDSCRTKNIKIIPTIFWTKTSAMHACLSSKKNRDAHIRQIINIVTQEKFDGININYERVLPEDRDHFITFIKDLSKQLHTKKLLLCCSIGGRTSDTSVHVIRPDSPENATHSFIGFTWSRLKNDLKNNSVPTVSLNPGTGHNARSYKKKLSLYCDQVHVMGYDEWGLPCKHSTTDLDNQYFISHCSNQWIEQIIDYALSFIPRHKIILGIPTYGLEFSYPSSEDLCFKKVRNVTYPQATMLAKQLNITPKRSSGGELTFTYKDKNEMRYICFLDTRSIKNKIDIACRHKIGGIYLFKIDGLEDHTMWAELENYKDQGLQSLPTSSAKANMRKIRQE